MRSELEWFKSSYSGDQGDDCVEVATCPKAIHIRDSKLELRGSSPRLTITPRAWGDFITELL
ncbi:DUF397 domain-containing protein [Streptomyces griseocarneus]|uniref:DUF397 domain-containing protein n=1 Tax=Streptomyces griseocarneus TaxID=51201 RepID=UPI00167E1930|nr:DUF397 domain-containing protein [Streptomyces griseocarneus]MBZ6477667.1 DUF397 domain-containing protein [Streptomyces griseocarneus]GHG82023.1 DUF397 domain-containing protein [Streptomyces griseocarneus]